MMSRLIPAALVLLIGGTSLAFAETVEGKIKAIDAPARTITLRDGLVIALPGAYDAAKLKIGETVKVVWQRKGDPSEATDIEVAK